MTWEDDNLSDKIQRAAERRLHEKNLEHSKASGICPQCHGSGEHDLGDGIKTLCEKCDGEGTWAAYERWYR